MTAALKFATNRAKLPRLNGRNLHIADIGTGVKLGFRPGAGAWIALIAKNGQQVPRKLGLADTADMPANGVTVLTYDQARDAAVKKAAELEGVDTTTPPTLDEVLTKYGKHLEREGKSSTDARLPRKYMPETLLVQRADKVTLATLEDWRNGLDERGVNRSTINRNIVGPLATALRHAAERSDRVALNARAWDVGLKKFAEADKPRDAVLEELEVQAVVGAAYDIDSAFGLWVQLHAVTGSRTSQLCRLTVGSLAGNKLTIPGDFKGKGKGGRKPVSVPLPADLVADLAAAAGDRPAHAPLLLKSSGEAWRPWDHEHLYARAAKAANLPEGRDTIYALRHSSIVHKLLKGVGVLFVAKAHHTSVAKIESNYAHLIDQHYDEQLLAATESYRPGSNVVPINPQAA
jgi:integrase